MTWRIALFGLANSACGACGAMIGMQGKTVTDVHVMLWATVAAALIVTTTVAGLSDRRSLPTDDH